MVYEMSANRSASVPHSSMPSGKSARCPARAFSASRGSRFPPSSCLCSLYAQHGTGANILLTVQEHIRQHVPERQLMCLTQI